MLVGEYQVWFFNPLLTTYSAGKTNRTHFSTFLTKFGLKWKIDWFDSGLSVHNKPEGSLFHDSLGFARKWTRPRLGSRIVIRVLISTNHRTRAQNVTEVTFSCDQTRRDPFHITWTRYEGKKKKSKKTNTEKGWPNSQSNERGRMH